MLAAKTPGKNTKQAKAAAIAAKPQKKSHKKLKIVLGIAAVLIIVIAAIFVHLFAQLKPAEAASTTFLNDMTSSQPAIAYHLTTAAFQQTVPQDKFVQLATELKAGVSGQPKRRAVTIMSYAGQPTTVNAAYAFNNSESKIVQLSLQKIDGKWLVASMDLPLAATAN